MKFLRPKFLTALLVLCFAFNAKAVNDTLTIGQAFDWAVGDTFIYQSHSVSTQHDAVTGSNSTTQKDTLAGFVVKSRLNSGDSIFYIIQSFADTTLQNFSIYNKSLNILGTCDFDNLDLGYCGPICFNNGNLYSFQDPDFNYLISDSISWGLRYSIVTEKIGLKKGYHFDWWNSGHTSGAYYCTVTLAYYRSASTNFIYNDVQEISNVRPSFSIYPNPATDELTITTENEAPADVSIYDMLGNCVLSHKNVSHNLVDMDVSLIPPGYYLLKLTDPHGLSSSKGFIIAR